MAIDRYYPELVSLCNYLMLLIDMMVINIQHCFISCNANYVCTFELYFSDILASFIIGVYMKCFGTFSNKYLYFYHYNSYKVLMNAPVLCFFKLKTYG